jgi:hypothetical protein
MNTALDGTAKEALYASVVQTGIFTVRGSAAVSQRTCCLVGGWRFSLANVKRARRCPMYSWRVRLAMNKVWVML